MDNTIGLLNKSIEKVEKWVEKHNYEGYEPFDALNSYWSPITFGNGLATRLFIQLVRQSPINLRPILGITPQPSNPGRGYMAGGYLKMLRLTGNLAYEKKAKASLDWLMEHKSPLYSQYSWGNQFEFISRGGRWPKFEPSIVWSSHIGQVFLDAYELFEDKAYLDVAQDVCKWILNLPKEKTYSGTCLSYYAFKQASIHNANMLGAAMLARTAKHTDNASYKVVAKEAMKYSCSRQLPDGAWYYAEASNSHWIDNFHTGYNLDSLKCYIDNTNDKTFDENLNRGFKYFKNTFFEKNGLPKYYHHRSYPIDIQCASQAIDTLAYLSEHDDSSLELSLKVAKWTIDNMQDDDDGYFYYRILPWIKVKTPMLHWGQATMYKALTSLLTKIN